MNGRVRFSGQSNMSDKATIGEIDILDRLAKLNEKIPVCHTCRMTGPLFTCVDWILLHRAVHETWPLTAIGKTESLAIQPGLASSDRNFIYPHCGSAKYQHCTLIV